MLGVVVVLAEVVWYGLLVGGVVVAGSQFLGSGRVGVVGRSIGVVFCCGVVLLGKSVMVWMVPFHACCRPGTRMCCRWSWQRYA